MLAPPVHLGRDHNPSTHPLPLAYSHTSSRRLPVRSQTIEKKEKVKRAPSAYNIFMKSELAKVKKASPNMDHKEAFAKAASGWATSKANPKNK